MARKACIAAIVLLIGAAAYSQEYAQRSNSTQASVSPSEAIRQIGHRPIRDGQRLVIQGQVYEVRTDERGVVLRPLESRNQAQDIEERGGRRMR